MRTKRLSINLAWTDWKCRESNLWCPPPDFKFGHFTSSRSFRNDDSNGKENVNWKLALAQLPLLCDYPILSAFNNVGKERCYCIASRVVKSKTEKSYGWMLKLSSKPKMWTFHPFVLQSTERNCTRVRAARLYFRTRPIKFLICGVFIVAPVVNAKAPCCFTEDLKHMSKWKTHMRGVQKSLFNTPIRNVLNAIVTVEPLFITDTISIIINFPQQCLHSFLATCRSIVINHSKDKNVGKKNTTNVNFNKKYT